MSFALRFNSTLVRFKPFMRNISEDLSQCFNSTLVRFKLMQAARIFGVSKQFQFHSGSIQTQIGLERTPEEYVFQFHSGSIQT